MRLGVIYCVICVLSEELSIDSTLLHSRTAPEISEAHTQEQKQHLGPYNKTLAAEIRRCGLTDVPCVYFTVSLLSRGAVKFQQVGG